MTWQPEIRAAAQSRGYTTLDLVIIAVLGVAFGLLNTPFGLVFQFLLASTGPLGQTIFQPWAIGMMLAMLIVGKPGAAVLNGLVNALFQILSGNPAGLLNLGWGLANGLGIELGIALYAYLTGSTRITWVTAFLCGFLAMACGYVVSAIAFNYASAGAEILLLSWLGQSVAGGIESGLVGYALALLLARSGLLKSFQARPQPTVPSAPASV
jgi:energy-coupling factor transport system substrate-specific component